MGLIFKSKRNTKNSSDNSNSVNFNIQTNILNTILDTLMENTKTLSKIEAKIERIESEYKTIKEQINDLNIRVTNLEYQFDKKIKGGK